MLLRCAFFVGCLVSFPLFAGPYDFLRKFEEGLPHPAREVSAAGPRNAEPPPLNLKMDPYYESITHSGEVRSYVGVGVEFYHPQVASQILSAAKALSDHLQLGLTEWIWEQEKSRLSFFDPQRQVRYFLTVGFERNEFIEALAYFPVVMYSGHSRLGRGPAFEDFSNYFRLGNIYATIEIDTRNRYFRTEPLKKTDEFPPLDVTLGGVEYEYQYRGQKDEYAHLPSDSYTKVIEGGPKDFNAATFMATPQLIFLWSCENSHYFKVPIRKKLTPGKALVFGTWGVPHHGLIAPISIFLISLARELPSSLDFVAELNQDESVYTAY